MATQPSSPLEAHWNWLRHRFNQLSDLARDADQCLKDPECSRSVQVEKLIEWGKEICRLLKDCKERDLFNAIADNDYATLDPKNKRLLTDLYEHLHGIMLQEQAVLVVAEIKDDAARELCSEIESRLRRSHLQPISFEAAWHQRVDNAIKSACDVPSTKALFYLDNFGRWYRSLKKRYGMIGLVAIAGANAVVVVKVPEPFTATKFSKLIAYLLLPTVDDGDPPLDVPPSDWTI